MIKKKLLLTTAAAMFTLGSAVSAHALPSTAVIAGTLKNIDTSVSIAVQTAEQLYVNNSGSALGSATVLTTTHPYFQTFQIDTDYSIQMHFAATEGTKVNHNGGTEGTIGTIDALDGKKILLVPVYTTGDAVITSWECLTDADIAYSQGLGVDAVDGDKSFITRFTKSPYLALCTYVAKGALDVNELF